MHTCIYNALWSNTPPIPYHPTNSHSAPKSKSDLLSRLLSVFILFCVLLFCLFCELLGLARTSSQGTGVELATGPLVTGQQLHHWIQWFCFLNGSLIANSFPGCHGASGTSPPSTTECLLIALGFWRPYTGNYNYCELMNAKAMSCPCDRALWLSSPRLGEVDIGISFKLKHP